MIRDNVTQIAQELDQRRRDLFDWRYQLKQHATMTLLVETSCPFYVRRGRRFRQVATTAKDAPHEESAPAAGCFGPGLGPPRARGTASTEYRSEGAYCCGGRRDRRGGKVTHPTDHLRRPIPPASRHPAIRGGGVPESVAPACSPS